MDLLLSGEFEVRLLQFLHVQLILKSAFPWHERLNINERRIWRGICLVINKNVLLSFQYEYSNKKRTHITDIDAFTRFYCLLCENSRDLRTLSV